eukprot:5322488-Prymnesium_polylepis.1
MRHVCGLALALPRGTLLQERHRPYGTLLPEACPSLSGTDRWGVTNMSPVSEPTQKSVLRVGLT